MGGGPSSDRPIENPTGRDRSKRKGSSNGLSIGRGRFCRRQGAKLSKLATYRLHKAIDAAMRNPDHGALHSEGRRANAKRCRMLDAAMIGRERLCYF